jgi:hypothetical protein
MKLALPADRNEKIKVLFMIGLFAAIGAFVLFNFGLNPFLEKAKKQKARLEELDQLLWRAENEINQIQRNRNRNLEALRSIRDVSETQRFILRPSLGNYLLVAESLLLQIAEESGVTLSSIRETGGPPPTGATANPRDRPSTAWFWPYSVSFSFHAGLHDAMRFIHHLQSHNPYLAITGIAISSGTRESPGQHGFSISVQWPVWRDPTYPNRLAAELMTEEDP